MTQAGTERTYVFAYSRFAWGCAYQKTSETTLICPEHRQPLTEEHELRSATRDFPPVEGLMMSRFFKTNPAIIRNSSRNSLHSVLKIRDGGGSEWSDDDENEVGLCPACYIDQQDLVETRITACECADPQCSYRWCGQLSGLHAYWRLHVQGRTHEATDFRDQEIFSYGDYHSLDEQTQETLDRERAELIRAGQDLLEKMGDSRSNDADDSPTGRIFRMPWLEQHYDVMNDPDRSNRLRETARQELGRRLIRLHLLGLIEWPDPAATPNLELASDQHESGDDPAATAENAESDA